MFKKRIWFGIILSVIFLAFSLNGFTAYYKYTQESGTNFYVGTDDKVDALENTNEIRKILDDLGNLLGHSKRDDLYPKNGTTGGYLGKLNYGLDAYKPADEAVIGYKPASEAEKGYKTAGESGGIIYYIFNVTIANKFRKLEDLFIYLLNRTDESLK